MNKIYYLIFLLGIFLVLSNGSCFSSQPVVVVDGYDAPSRVKVNAGDGEFTISFYNINLAGDFLGYNLYVSEVSNIFTINPITNSDGGFPTFTYGTHDYEEISFSYDMDILNGTIYYVNVTAYGTNTLVDEDVVESSFNQLFIAIGRPEGSIAGFINNRFNGATNDGLVINGDDIELGDGADIESALSSIFYFTIKEHVDGVVIPLASSGESSSVMVQDLGYYDNFDDVNLLPTNGYLDAGTYIPLKNKHMFALYGGGIYSKVWIESFEEKETYNEADTVSISIKWARQTISDRNEI